MDYITEAFKALKETEIKIKTKKILKESKTESAYLKSAKEFVDTIPEMSYSDAEKWWNDYNFSNHLPEDDAEKIIYDALKAKLDSEGISSKDLPATYKLEPTGKLKKAEEAVYIEFYLEYKDTVAVGDKLVYFSANKAVIKNIIPEENYPYTDFRPNEPIDAFVSEVSISKRIVTSSVIDGSINKLLIELDRTCKDKLGIKYDDSKV